MSLARMPLWLVPMLYAVARFAVAMTLRGANPLRFRCQRVFVSSAQSFFAAVASGMILDRYRVLGWPGHGTVQHDGIFAAASMMFARDPMLFHSLGVFIATFLYSLGALAWVDRERSGIVPLFSVSLVAAWCCSACCSFSPADKGI